MKPLKHLTVLLNPAADGGRGARTQAALEAELSRQGVPYSLDLSKGPGHTRALARAAGKGKTDLLLVVGGDGTVHEAANGLLDGPADPPPLAVLPVGTGNDFFRLVGKRKDPAKILAGLSTASVQSFDVGRVRYDDQEAFFVNLLGVGVDVEVLRRRQRFPWLRGLPQYLAALASALFSFRAEPFRITFDTSEGDDGKGSIHGRTLLMAVTVGPSVGGGFLLSPDASPVDGRLDLFFAPRLGMFKLASAIPRVIRGSHQGIPDLVQAQVVGASVTRTDGAPFWFEMDGEVLDKPVHTLTIQVIPEALRVVVPGSTP